MAGVLDAVAPLIQIQVVGLAVGDQQQQLAPLFALAEQLGGLANGRTHARVITGFQRLDPPAGVIAITLLEALEFLHADLLATQRGKAIQREIVADGRQCFAEQKQAVGDHVDHLVLVVQVRVGGHRQVGQQQACQVATILPLFHEQPTLGALAMLALDVKVQPGLHVQLRALGLTAQPLPIVSQVFELPAQLARQRAQPQRQAHGFGASRQHHLQADEVLLHVLFAVIPFRQLDAIAQRNVIDVRGRQIEVQFEAATLAHALTRHGNLVEIFSNAGSVLVFAVIALTIKLDMLGPAEQVLQTEQHQAALAGAVLDTLGALAHALLLGRRGLQVVVLIFLSKFGGLRHAEIFRRVQPHGQRPGGHFATRKLLNTARLPQGLADGSLQRCLRARQRIRVGTQPQMRLDQARVTRLHGRKTLEDDLRPALVVTRPMAHLASLRRKQRQPAIEILVE